MSVGKSLSALVLSAVLSVCASFAICTAVLARSAEAEVYAQTADYGKYYYGQLKTARAKKLYDAIGALDKKTGNAALNLIESEILTSAEAEKFAVGGDSALMLDFGSARDAYALDHPEVFYADISQLNISAGKRNGNYTATLGSGREESYYVRGTDGTYGFDGVNAVESASAELENALKYYDKYEGQNPEVIVKSVNKDLTENTVYGFGCTYDSSAQGTVYAQTEPYVHTAYGALVCGESVGDGYAKAFKVIMDRLGVPCVLVQGVAFSDAQSGAGQKHYWNYVKIDGQWYAVDSAANDGMYTFSEKYLLVGESVICADHAADGVVSPAGYEFAYPALSANNYGADESDERVNQVKNYECTVVYDGNALYGQPYGAPQALGKISVDGWEYSENGRNAYFAEGQSGQLMITSSQPDDRRGAVERRLNEELYGGVLEACLYDVNMYVCGKAVARGEQITLGFGFPGGYGLNGKAAYRVYSYNYSDGNIADLKQINCVSTQCGIVAQVGNGCSVAVVAVDGGKANSSLKNIYACSDGNGTVCAANGSYGYQSIYGLESGSVKYSFAPAEGYLLDYVTLNGKIMSTDGNTLELDYGGLDGGNALEAHFVRADVKADDDSRGFVYAAPPAMLFDPMGEIKAGLTCVEERGGGYTLTASHSVTDNYVTGKVRYEWYKDGKLLVFADGGAYAENTLRLKDGEKGEYYVKAVYEYSGRVKTAESKPVKTGSSKTVWIIAASAVSGAVVVGAVTVMLVLHFRKKKTLK